MIRRTGDWQRLTDDRILEYLREHDLARPAVIAREVSYPTTTGHVRDRLRALAQVDYVAPVSDDYELYEVTNLGIAYLEGRARADLIYPPPSPSRASHVRA